MNRKVSISVCLIANKIHTVDSVFDTRAETILIRESFLEVDYLRATRPNNRLSLSRAINYKISVVPIITLQVRMADSTGGGVFRAVRNLAVSVLLRTSFIHRFMRGSFPPDWMIVPFHSKPEPNLVIKNLSEELRENDKARNIMITEDMAHAWCTVRDKRRFTQDQKETLSLRHAQAACIDRFIIKVGQYSMMNDSLGLYRRINVLDI